MGVLAEPSGDPLDRWSGEAGQDRCRIDQPCIVEKSHPRQVAAALDADQQSLIDKFGDDPIGGRLRNVPASGDSRNRVLAAIDGDSIQQTESFFDQTRR